MKKLVVAEKPSVARDIARVLGASKQGEGCIVGEEYIITWAIGHLVTLKEPEEMNAAFKKWRREDLPILPDVMETKVIRKTAAQFKNVKKLMNDEQVDQIICATDSGREGELIFRYIYEMAHCRKQVQRLWISSMTDEAIRSGFMSLRPASEYDALYRSARCRAEADWLIGMNATRAYSIRYNALLSIGRVQTPTLSMLVKRRREIDGFRPETYYTVSANFGDYQGRYMEPDGNKRIADLKQAEAIASRIKGKEAVVVRISAEKKSELPPLLYDLTALQRDANMKFGFTAQKTLATAQSLYEKHKLLTYPRTDSRYLSSDMMQKVKSALNAYDAGLESIAQKALALGVSLKKRVFNDSGVTDHHAIIPTGKRSLNAHLSADERKLYDLVARRLAAVFYPTYEYEATKVYTECESDLFISTGKRVLNIGWKETEFKKEEAKKKKGEDDEQKLPELSQGDHRIVKDAQVDTEQTKPPKEHNDASLLREMEFAGKRLEDEVLREQMKDCALGTPATRAAIIERLIKVGYVKRTGRSLTATTKGMRLIDAVPNDIASAEITGRWERELAQIAKGKDSEKRFREGIARFAAYLVEQADKAPDIPFEQEQRRKKGRAVNKDTGKPCPICGKGRIAENTKAFYCTRYKEGCTLTIWKNALERFGGPELTRKLLDLCMEQKDVIGSTGVIHYKDGMISFEKKRGQMKEVT